MRTKQHLVTIITVGLSLLLATVFTGCIQTAKSQQSGSSGVLRIVTTTSLIASIVEYIGGDDVQVESIIPPALCPAYFDISPSAIRMVADGELLLKHGWQSEAFTDKLVASADNTDLKIVTLTITGNWMVPPVYVKAIMEIAEVLSECDQENQQGFRDRADGFIRKVTQKGTEITAELDSAGVGEINVLCAERQAGFLIWAGFNVVDSYPPPEELTPQHLQRIIEAAREAEVGLVIDNLQSGPDSGAVLANEIDAKHVALSNFPGGFKGAYTWEETIQRNVDLLLMSLRE